jgi:hypothetical protein
VLIAEDIQVEWDEGGCFLMVDGERWKVADPEALYDRVKAVIGPWLRERDEAKATMPAYFACDPDESGYDVSDPKHPDHHSIHVDIWDMREGK